MTKSSFQSPAVAQFAGTGVRVTCEGRPYIGAAIAHRSTLRSLLMTRSESGLLRWF